MKLYYILHSMSSQKGANAIKVISVAIGLLASILVFCRLNANYSYDKCFPDRDNLYQIWMSYEINGETLGPFSSCPGRLAEGAIEALGDDLISATATGHIGLPDLFDGDRLLHESVFGVDSLYFKTMGLEILQGNPMADFTVPGTIYISESLANQLYGKDDPIGKTLTFDREKEMTVRGVYRDYPDNVTVKRAKALISIPTYPQYEGRRYWAGGDNWPVYFRLKPGHKLTETDINSRLNRMYQSHNPDTDEVKTVITALPISRTYLDRDAVKRMNLILWILGSSLLLMTTLNYVLITIASLSRRAKSIGVQKYSGAGSGTIMSMFLIETLIVLLCSIVLMGVILYVTEPLIERTLTLTPAEIFAPDRLWLPISLLAFFFLIGGLLPGRIFARIPVTQVFRRFTERNSTWKRSLLFIQIAGVSFVCSILIVVAVQYHDLVNRDMGFSVKNLASFGIPYNVDRNVFKTTVADLPYVEAIAAAEDDPLGGYSGSMVTDGKGATLFNTRINWIDENYIDIMGITLLQGREPKKRYKEAAVSEEFIRRIGFGADPLGKTTIVDGDTLEIVGVVKDYIIGGFTNDLKPIVLIAKDRFSGMATVRLKEPFDANRQQLEAFLDETFPNNRFDMYSLPKRAVKLYSDVRMFRDSALMAAVTLIFISLMGLVGFARDEVQRRSKEIAIRKVNGAESIDIINLLTADILRLALPATIIGTLLAAYVSHVWLLSNFSVTAPHIWIYYILADIAVIALVISCVLSIILRTANENPVNRLKVNG